MEGVLLERLHRNLGQLADPHRRLTALSAARSLISNPNSNDSTRRSAVDSLCRFLGHQPADPAFLRPALKILGEAAALHRALSPSVVAAVKSFLDPGNSLAADAVAALAAIAESGEKGEGFALVGSVLDEGLLLSLASGTIVAVRSRVLELLVRSVDRGPGSSLLRPEVLIRLLLGLADDLYPSVRRGALEGLRRFLKETENALDSWILDCCYERAAMLLKDPEEDVRVAAIQLVCNCGLMLQKIEEDVNEQINGIFILLCSMARDMFMKVRVEAFIALGNMKFVSENVLLQSLSKKFLGGNQNAKALSAVPVSLSKFPSRSAAGAFVHGIEDEFYEVRTIACKSLGILSIYSNQFASEAVNLLMDMLNNDSETVQLQTLETLSHIATHDRLTIHEKHVHMFLILLSDISALIRNGARKLLQLMKLPDFTMFKTTIDCLIKALEGYLEEEEDVFLTLAFLGKNHRKFSSKLAKEFAEEVVLSSKCELSLDSMEVASKLVLSISSSFLSKQQMVDIPVVLYSYAIPFVGRISRALRGEIDQDSLLCCLLSCSGSPFSAMTSESKEAANVCSSSVIIHYAGQETEHGDKLMDSTEFSISNERSHCKDYWSKEDVQFIKSMLKSVGEAWLFIKSRHTHEALKILRSCTEALGFLSWSSGFSLAFLELTSCYIQIIQLIAELLASLNLNKSFPISAARQELLLEDLHTHLRKLRYCFPGLEVEEECHILELSLLGYFLSLLKAGIGSNLVLKKLHNVLSHLEFLSNEGSFELSDFTKEIRNVCTGNGINVLYSHSTCKLLDLFHTDQIPFTGKFRHKKALLLAINNDSENPLAYVPGLPAAIHFKITLYNIASDDRLWLLMMVDDSVQYVFLDIWKFLGFDTKNCILDVPYYGTPKAASFFIKACVALECEHHEITDWRKSHRGPLGGIALLSEEIYVYLVNIENR